MVILLTKRKCDGEFIKKTDTSVPEGQNKKHTNSNAYHLYQCERVQEQADGDG